MKESSNSINVTISAPEAILWQGEVEAVSSSNSEGEFDILPDHARFMTLIEAYPITIKQVNKEHIVFNFPSAVLFFEDNQAKIYVHKKEA